jgi:predicted AAA+ superfamily ATPase
LALTPVLPEAAVRVVALVPVVEVAQVQRLPAVLDEAQKAPDVFEKLKWAYDEGQLDYSVLLGSSRILLLDRVRESLAGRVFSTRCGR